MLRLLFKAYATVDRALSPAQQRNAARQRARHAHAIHGAQAVDHLLAKLRDQRRRRSRRELRLAIAELIG